MWKRQPTKDPYIAWLMFIATLSLGLVIIRFVWRLLLRLVRGDKRFDRPSDYHEERIKRQLASGKHGRPAVNHTGRTGWSHLDAIRQTRPQPRIGGSAGWGDGINKSQQEKHGKMAGRR